LRTALLRPGRGDQSVGPGLGARSQGVEVRDGGVDTQAEALFEPLQFESVLRQEDHHESGEPGIPAAGYCE